VANAYLILNDSLLRTRNGAAGTSAQFAVDLAGRPKESDVLSVARPALIGRESSMFDLAMIGIALACFIFLYLMLRVMERV
jgi:hypothetical protein